MANHFDFQKDHKIAVKTELEVARLLRLHSSSPIKNIQLNNDSRWDLKVTFCDGETMTIEVKEDFTCARTGNVGLEFECRGKLSGISVSQADAYMYKLHEPSGEVSFYLIDVDVLKALIEERRFIKTVVGGDPGSQSKNYLFSLKNFKENATLFHRVVSPR